MKNAIRCCISCILPCGSLDVIRIVHCNGHVEEIAGTIRASDVMKANPKHVLKKPSSHSHDSLALLPNIVIVPPDAHLQRGKIYFLMPLPPAPEKPRSTKKKKKKELPVTGGATNNLVVSDRYLSEILSEKLSTGQKDKRRGRVGVWRPHLQSISEFPTDL